MTDAKRAKTRIYRLQLRGTDKDSRTTFLIEATSQSAALQKYASEMTDIDVPSALEVAREVRDGAEVIAS